MVTGGRHQHHPSLQTRRSWDKRSANWHIIRRNEGQHLPCCWRPPLFVGVWWPQPLVYPSPAAHQTMLEVRICLLKPSFLIVSVIINTDEMKCQQRTHLSESSKHTKLNKSTGAIVNDPLQSLSLKKFHLKVLKNVRGLIMWWEHRTTRQSFQPAASRKPLLWKAS